MVDHVVVHLVAQVVVEKMMETTCFVEASDVIDLVVVHLRVVALVFRLDVDLCSKGTRQS